MNTTQQGAQAEQQAAAYLNKLGYEILERNFRAVGGELDLVALHNKTLVFVEVKQRSSRAFGGPIAAVTATKQKRVAKAATQFLKSHPHLKYDQIRFDIISVLPGEMLHIPNAFVPPRTNL